MKQEFIVPIRIVMQDKAHNAENLLQDRPRQIKAGTDADSITIKESGYIVLDMGKEINGGILYTIFSVSQDNAQMRVVFGESVSEVLSTLGEKNSTNDHAIRDTLVSVTPLSSQQVGQTGFRFVKIEAVNSDLIFGCVQGVLVCAALEYKGEFVCSDPLLNEIWKVGAYTVHLNTQEYIWDGIKRDRLVWIGDMHPEISTIAAVFGNIPQVTRSLDFVRNTTPDHAFMNGFASYSMWWLIIQRDWYLYTGDRNYLVSQKEQINRTVTPLLERIHEDGSFQIADWFVDWPTSGKPDAQIGFQGLLVLCLKAVAELYDWLQMPKDTILSALDAVINFLPECTQKNKQMTAMSALAGQTDIEQAREIIIKDGAYSLSTFWGFYTLQALAMANDMESACKLIRDYWGKMIELGATTFFEDFDMAWAENAAPIDELVPQNKKDLHGDFGAYCYKGFRHSLCHGWASGPTAFLTRFVLGVTPAEPGFRKINVMPNLGDLTWARGKIPTPYGEIAVHHEKQPDGTIKTELKLPEGIEKY